MISICMLVWFPCVSVSLPKRLDDQRLHSGASVETDPSHFLSVMRKRGRSVHPLPARGFLDHPIISKWWYHPISNILPIHIFNTFYFCASPDSLVFPCVSGASPKFIKLQEVPSDYTDLPKGKCPAVNSNLVPVKGINNLGNTCFFNAVMQVGMIRRHIYIYKYKGDLGAFPDFKANSE